MNSSTTPHKKSRPTASIAILGVPFDNVTTEETIRLIEQMIDSRQPHYLATANVDFVVQALKDVELRRILHDAHLVICDGTPLIWASRWLGNPLPERVAGSDLVPILLRVAEKRGARVFFLGGREETIQRAIEKIKQQYPHLQIAGQLSPPFAHILEMDHEGICRAIRKAKPDLLFVSFGCPKQEKWLNMNYRSANVPVAIGVGGTIDFLAGDRKRAPVWMRRSGTEWIFRLIQEPRRLFLRYLTDLWVFGWAILHQWWKLQFRSKTGCPMHPMAISGMNDNTFLLVSIPQRFDAAVVQEYESEWNRLLSSNAHLLINLTGVDFIDSTGLGLLVRLQKNLRSKQRQLTLVAPGKHVMSALKLMHFTEFFPIASSVEDALKLIQSRINEENVVLEVNLKDSNIPLAWQGEIVAANVEQVWTATETHLQNAKGGLIIDLSGVRFIDSSGVGLMVRARKQGKLLGVDVRFVNAKPVVTNVIRTLRMEDFLFGPRQ